MADPKYANLPGIDLGAPDVYETNDLPEDEQVEQEQDDGITDCVEELTVTASEAFEKFKDKTVNTTTTDFSDKVGKHRKTGYDVPRTEYELVGNAEPETPQQRYQRLQHELRELVEEMNKVKENVAADSATEVMSPVVIAQQAEYLQRQLCDLHLDQLLGPGTTVSLADPQGALHRRLVSQLDGFKEPSGEEKSKPVAVESAVAAGDPSHVTYQLYYRPEQAKFSNNARVADLEQRIERMEALLGHNTDKLSMLTADTANKSLLGAVALLNAKTKLLEPTQLEQIEGRLSALNHKLTQISERKDIVEQGDKQSKVLELFDLVKKWDSLANTLPHIVDRLTALKDLHEQALQFSQALAHLDTSQQQISGLMGAHGDMLKEVHSTLDTNMSTIKSNCQNLEERLKTLKK